MATLTRVRERVQPQRPLVDTGIPAPFPRDLLQKEEHQVQGGTSSVDEVEERASRVSESSDGHQSGTVVRRLCFYLGAQGSFSSGADAVHCTRREILPNDPQ